MLRSKKKQEKLILIMYFIKLSLSQMLSFQQEIKIKDYSCDISYRFWYHVLEMQCVPRSPAQYGPATFQGLSSHPGNVAPAAGAGRGARVTSC